MGSDKFCKQKMNLAQKSWLYIQAEEWVVIVYRQFSNFSAISCREQVNFQWDDEN